MENKVKAAISAAVFTYIKTGEEACALEAEQDAQQDVTGVQTPAAAFEFNSWGFAGRQAQMQQRAMMQMRAFK